MKENVEARPIEPREELAISTSTALPASRKPKGAASKRRPKTRRRRDYRWVPRPSDHLLDD